MKTEEECDSNLDVWLYSLKHLDEKNEIPRHLKKTIFEKLYHIAEYSKMNKEEQRMYDQDLKRKRDNEAAFTFREEQGKYEGRIEGRIEGKLEVAVKMKAKGIPADEIEELTGISIEEINAL